MRLYLVNPGNPVASLNQVHWNRLNKYRVWNPHGLLVPAGLMPPGWEVTPIGENLGRPDYSYPRILRRMLQVARNTRSPMTFFVALVAILSLRSNHLLDRRRYASRVHSPELGDLLAAEPG